MNSEINVGFGISDELRIVDTFDDDDEIMRHNLNKYDNFTTIDWTKELAKDRSRRKEKLINKNKSIFSWLGFWLESGSGWACVMLVGIFTGVLAAVVDIGDGWLTDLKFGLCTKKFWLNREHCCLNSLNSNCTDWERWTIIFGTTQGSFLYFLIDFFIYTSSAVSMALLAGFLVLVFAPYAAGSGIAEIKCILSGFVIRRFLGISTLWVKAVGLILASSSGLALGKEGPAVHLACCIGNIVTRWFPKYRTNEAKKREIFSASAAAALSVAFGAPIGGVMFSVEEASYYFTFKTLWRSFFCALIAGLAVRFVNPFGNTLPSLYHVEQKLHWIAPELIPFLFIGIIGGLLGSAFVKLNMLVCRWRKTSSIKNHPLLEIGIVTFVTTILAYTNPFTKTSSLSLIRQMFNGCEKGDDVDFCYDYPSDEIGLYFQLFMAIAMKFIFTTITAGLKVPAGLFVPNIALGAVIGRTVGLITQDLAREYMIYEGNVPLCTVGKDCVMPGLYAIVGAAATLCGVMRMTVTLAIIMFELTGSIDFVVPTMAAIMIAKWVGDATYPTGIYDAQIELNGYPFLDNKEEMLVGSTAKELMQCRRDRHLSIITKKEMAMGKILEILNETKFCGFPVIEDEFSKICIGFVDRKDLQAKINKYKDLDHSTRISFDYEEFSNNINWSKIVDRAPFTANLQTPVEILAEMFKKLGVRQVLITEHGEILDIITKKDLIRFMHHH